MKFLIFRLRTIYNFSRSALDLLFSLYFLYFHTLTPGIDNNTVYLDCHDIVLQLVCKQGVRDEKRGVGTNSVIPSMHCHCFVFT